MRGTRGERMGKCNMAERRRERNIPLTLLSTLLQLMNVKDIVQLLLVVLCLKYGSE